MDEKISPCPKCNGDIVLEEDNTYIDCPYCDELLLSQDGKYITFEAYTQQLRERLEKDG